MVTRRKKSVNKHQPGRDNSSHESRQAEKVGKMAKTAYAKGNKHTGPHYAANSLRTNEPKMSISASKIRERSRSKKR